MVLPAADCAAWSAGGPCSPSARARSSTANTLAGNPGAVSASDDCNHSGSIGGGSSSRSSPCSVPASTALVWLCSPGSMDPDARALEALLPPVSQLAKAPGDSAPDTSVPTDQACTAAAAHSCSPAALHWPATAGAAPACGSVSDSLQSPLDTPTGGAGAEKWQRAWHQVSTTPGTNPRVLLDHRDDEDESSSDTCGVYDDAQDLLGSCPFEQAALPTHSTPGPTPGCHSASPATPGSSAAAPAAPALAAAQPRPLLDPAAEPEPLLKPALLDGGGNGSGELVDGGNGSGELVDGGNGSGELSPTPLEQLMGQLHDEYTLRGLHARIAEGREVVREGGGAAEHGVEHADRAADSDAAQAGGAASNSLPEAGGAADRAATHTEGGSESVKSAPQAGPHQADPPGQAGTPCSLSAIALLVAAATALLLLSLLAATLLAPLAPGAACSAANAPACLAVYRASLSAGVDAATGSPRVAALELTVLQVKWVLDDSTGWWAGRQPGARLRAVLRPLVGGAWRAQTEWLEEALKRGQQPSLAGPLPPHQQPSLAGTLPQQPLAGPLPPHQQALLGRLPPQQQLQLLAGRLSAHWQQQALAGPLPPHEQPPPQEPAVPTGAAGRAAALTNSSFPTANGKAAAGAAGVAGPTAASPNNSSPTAGSATASSEAKTGATLGGGSPAQAAAIPAEAVVEPPVQGTAAAGATDTHLTNASSALGSHHGGRVGSGQTPEVKPSLPAAAVQALYACAAPLWGWSAAAEAASAAAPRLAAAFVVAVAAAAALAATKLVKHKQEVPLAYCVYTPRSKPPPPEWLPSLDALDAPAEVPTAGSAGSPHTHARRSTALRRASAGARSAARAAGSAAAAAAAGTPGGASGSGTAGGGGPRISLRSGRQLL